MNREHYEAALHRNKATQAAVATLEFLANKSVANAVKPRALVTVNGTAEQTEVRDHWHQFTRELVLFEGFLHGRDDLVIDKAGDRVLNHKFVF